MTQKNILVEFDKFAKEVFAQLDALSETLLEAIQYSFFGGGKRIRAQFVYAMGEALEIKKQNCNKIAFAIEAIHTYSLIHDDLPAMDNDVLRRGQPTCHIKFDESTAILAGDALQALAFEVIQDIEIENTHQLKKIIKILAQCCGAEGMVGGQQLDIEGENKKLGLEALEVVHINKTAKMFTASILIPYFTIKDDFDGVEELLIELSELIGLCFQIKDDILDVTKTTEELGKTSAKDIDSNKSTYVSLMGLEDANKYLINKKNQITTILEELNKYYDLTTLTRLINLVIDRNY